MQIVRARVSLSAFGLSASSVVIGFGVSDSAEDILACAGSGLSGFVATDASAQDIVLAVQGTLRGEFPCPPRLAQILFQKLSALAQSGVTSQEGARERLTNREIAVARLLDQGLSNKEIARQLNIGVTTVKNHLHNIFEKLDVHRRGEATAALRGILNLSIQNRVAS
jgi:DNA-binding NarL/FixJ family response regulator